MMLWEQWSVLGWLKGKFLELTGKAVSLQPVNNTRAQQLLHIFPTVSWRKLWDMALDHEERGTTPLQALFYTLTRPRIGGQSACPLCETQQAESSPFEYFVTCHTPIARMKEESRLTSSFFDTALKLSLTR